MATNPANAHDLLGLLVDAGEDGLAHTDLVDLVTNAGSSGADPTAQIAESLRTLKFAGHAIERSTHPDPCTPAGAHPDARHVVRYVLATEMAA